MDDEDDAFLYGDSSAPAAAPQVPTSTAAAADDVLDFELDGESTFGVGATESCIFLIPNVNPICLSVDHCAFCQNHRMRHLLGHTKSCRQ
jgi:hypothetical protein